MTLIWVAIAVLFYLVLSKREYSNRVSSVIEDKNAYNQRFSITFRNALAKSSLFLKHANVSKDDWENYKDLSKEKKKKLDEFVKYTLKDAYSISFSYFPMNKQFLVVSEDKTYPVIAEMGASIYSHSLLGEDVGIFGGGKYYEDALIFKFAIDYRFGSKYNTHMLVGYLAYQESTLTKKNKAKEEKYDISGPKWETDVLFEMPLVDPTGTIMEKLGWEHRNDFIGPNRDPLTNEMSGGNYTEWKNKKGIEVNYYDDYKSTY